MKQFDTQIPESNFPRISRLISRDNVIYFGEEETPLHLSSFMTNSIDAPLRILSHLLSETDYKIRSLYSGYWYEKDELRNLWNNIKREEKLIRSDEGLVLQKINGDALVYKDPSYRVYWPSFEGFVADYPPKCQKGWLVLDIPSSDQSIINLINEKRDFFGKLINIEQKEDLSGFVTFVFTLDVGEQYFMGVEWRRLTETLLNILPIKRP